MPQHQNFCMNCGAHQGAANPRATAKNNVLSRLKRYFREVFRSEAEKQFDELAMRSPSLEAAIPRLQEIVNLEPENTHFRGILAIFYDSVASERLDITLMELSSRSLQFSGKIQAKEILSWVNKIRQSEEKGASKYGDAYAGLDKALNGALAMYEKSIEIDSGNIIGYSGRASAFQLVADKILMAHGIFPQYFIHSINEIERKPVKYVNTQFGICLDEEVPDTEFTAAILWLYKQAQEDYQEALKEDPTDVASYIGLSRVLRQLGKGNEAIENLDKALAVVNKALQIYNADELCYSYRADIFEGLGEIASAISDLERVLTLSTKKFTLDSTRQKIERLRKMQRD